MRKEFQDRIQEVETWLDRLYISAPNTTLRKEDKRKAIEVAAMLQEIERAARTFARRKTLQVVDAAAGKSYVGLLAARLVFEPAGLAARILLLEKDRRLMELSRRAMARLESGLTIECREADVADLRAWPAQPDIVVALHACGSASDAIIEAAIACGARRLLLVPCCTSEAVPGALEAQDAAARLGISRQAPIRRRFIQAMVDTHRTKRLEGAGYATEVVEFVGATVTPHNLLWRARLVPRTNTT